jgi:glycerol-3-phosphate dehydrogenase
MNRTHAISKLVANSSFDICIVGGGATGAGCALDAAARGYRVLLVEKEDFGAATSSKSTKLIHGGVRYLEQAVKKLSWGQFTMVRKALKERSTLLKIAPHITRPLQLITPCRTWVEGLYYFIGLKLYDVLSGRTNLGSSELLTKRKALERIPTLKKPHVVSAVMYYDGQLDDQRFNLALVQTAAQQGAICLNHLALCSFETNGQGALTHANLRCQLTGAPYQVAAKVFVNATGPFADGLRGLANPKLPQRLRVSRGVHIVLPKPMMPSAQALLIPQTADGRLIFAIPYQKHLLVGTTDDEAVLTDADFGPTAAEVDYLLQYLNDYLDVNASPDDLMSGFGGLRPLVMAAGGQTKDLIRDHEVELDAQSQLISILGGKWTTYRLMAKDTIDTAERILQRRVPCATHQLRLVGSQNFGHHTAIALQQATGWDHEVVKHLCSKYGDAALSIGQSTSTNPELAERLLPGMPYTHAELQHVLVHEMACTVKDVIGRRWGTQLANLQQAQQLIPVVGQLMAAHFGWNAEQCQQHIGGYLAEVAQIVDQMMQRQA